MAGSRTREVADQLLEKARRAELAWVGPTDHDAYYVPLPDGMSLCISRLSWLPGPPPALPGLPDLPDLRRVTTYGYKLELFDESGPMIGSLAGTTGDVEYRTLREMFELAEGEKDDAQDKLEKALDYLKRVEEPPNGS